MPEISRFFGIIITMYASDHVPPHFHVRYNDFQALFEIRTGIILRGDLPRKQRILVEAWIELHRDELLMNWEESQKENPSFKNIDPLR